jgi:hypothetical protein
MNTSEQLHFELRFRSLAQGDRGMAFPCDSEGRVDLDAMSDRARNTYFYARTVIGREFAMPTVRRND